MYIIICNPPLPLSQQYGVVFHRGLRFPPPLNILPCDTHHLKQQAGPPGTFTSTTVFLFFTSFFFQYTSNTEVYLPLLYIHFL